MLFSRAWRMAWIFPSTPLTAEAPGNDDAVDTLQVGRGEQGRSSPRRASSAGRACDRARRRRGAAIRPPTGRHRAGRRTCRRCRSSRFRWPPWPCSTICLPLGHVGGTGGEVEPFAHHGIEAALLENQAEPRRCRRHRGRRSPLWERRRRRARSCAGPARRWPDRSEPRSRRGGFHGFAARPPSAGSAWS